MATFFTSPTLLANPITKTQLRCSQAPRNPLPRTQQPIQPPSQPSSPPPPPPAAKPQQKPKLAAESTDWIASSLTRRFGLGAGLAWAAFLAVGVVSEQIKTRFEASQQEANTKDVEKEEEIVLPNGIRVMQIFGLVMSEVFLK